MLSGDTSRNWKIRSARSGGLTSLVVVPEESRREMMTARLADEGTMGRLDAGEGAAWDVSHTTVQEGRPAVEARSVLVVSADSELRNKLAASLAGLRWRVREAGGGAEAMMHLERHGSEAMLVDHWLPDLEVREFAAYSRLMYPEMDLLCRDGELDEDAGDRPGCEGLDGRARSPRRNELLHAMREAWDGARESNAVRAGDQNGSMLPSNSFSIRAAQAFLLSGVMMAIVILERGAYGLSSRWFLSISAMRCWTQAALRSGSGGVFST